MRGRHKAEEEKLIKEAKMMARRDGIEAVAGEEPGVSAWLGAMKQQRADCWTRREVDDGQLVDIEAMQWDAITRVSGTGAG